MKRLFTLILVLAALTACTPQTAQPSEFSSETAVTSAVKPENAETSPESGTAAEEEEKRAYLAAKKMSEKDNSGIAVTYCAAAEKFLAGENPTNEQGLIFDYGDMTFAALREEGRYPRTLCFVKVVDGGISCGLNIGTPIERVLAVLGEPNGYSASKNCAIYYFDGYCAAFYGKENIECICLLKMPPLDESCKNVLADAIKIIEEVGCDPSEEYGVYDYEVLERLCEMHPDYYYLSSENGWCVAYPNGFEITDCRIGVLRHITAASIMSIRI